MTSRDRNVIVVVVVLVAIVACWLIVIQPKRSEAGNLGSQVSAAESKVTTERATVVQDEAARASFASSYAELARLGEAVPADDDVPSMLYQLQNAASEAHVDFRALTLDAQTATATPAASTASKSSSSSSSSTSAAAEGASDTSLPPGAAVGPAGFPTENFTLTFQGNFFHLSNFFKRLEAMVQVTNRRVLVSGRLMTVNAITLGPGAGGFPTMEASVSATTYLVPAAQGLTAGATATGPSGSGTSGVTGSANPSSVAPATVTP
ncbi:MAG TPA: hypothetical protein VMD48_01245 [Solirubrobacteraceae bacterium]|nr:hypothetical protein [Solirubrobacteraceae bacterium]